MAKSLLLVSAVPEDQQFAAEVAQHAGMPLQVIADPREAAQYIAQDQAGAVFVDSSSEEQYRSFESAVQDTIGLFSDKIGANMIHYVSSQDLQKVTYLFQSPLFGHYVCRNYGDVKRAGRRYGMILKATQLDRAFGLGELLPDKTKIQSVSFKRTSQKQEGVEAVKNFLLAAKFKSRMATVIANAVDELLMNGMFDAPVDELGRPVYIATPRDTQFDLTGRQSIEMHVGYDGEYIAITAVDFFGSLDKIKLFSHISKRYIEEEYQVKKFVAGAGIGLATVFRSGGSFLFSCESGARTEVTVFFRRTDNFREFKDQFRFISTQFYF